MLSADARITQTNLTSRSGALWSSLRVSRRDPLVACGVGVVLALAVAAVPEGPESVGLRAFGVGLAPAEAGSLLWIRRAPGWAMAAALAAGVAIQALYPFAGSWGGATIPLSRLSRLRPPRV
jgi:hypothetical protein